MLSIQRTGELLTVWVAEKLASAVGIRASGREGTGADILNACPKLEVVDGRAVVVGIITRCAGTELMSF